MPTALEFKRMGVVFQTSCDPADPLFAQPRVRAPSPEIYQAVVAEVAARRERYAEALASGRRDRTLRITAAPEARYGACQKCGDAIQPHASYVCVLCTSALRKLGVVVTPGSTREIGDPA